MLRMSICVPLVIKVVKLSHRVCFLCAISQDAVSESWLNLFVECVGAAEVKGAGPHISAFYSVHFPHSISENAF